MSNDKNEFIEHSKIKVLLIHAPFKEHLFGEEWEPTETLSPPLGLMYMATNLIKRGYAVSFIDLNIDKFSREELATIISDKTFILISCFTLSLKTTYKIIEFIKNINEHAFILCGGPHCNLTRHHINGSDITVVGEAEGSIDEILRRVYFKEPLDDIPGLIYKKDSQIIYNPGILQSKNLDDHCRIPFNLIKDKDYGYFLGYKIKGAIGVLSSRGCPFHCTFCTFKGILPYRERSVESVVEDLKALKRDGYKYVIFFDDNFLLNKNRVMKIMDGIIKNKINLKMIVQGRVDSIDLDFYKKLRKAGVVLVLFGIESANQDVLDFYQKQIKIEQIKKAIELTNRVGILTQGWFILGSPLETEKHFLINENFINRVPLDFIHINILGYYKGSKLWEDALKAGLITENQAYVLTNEKLSHYSYQEWLAFNEKLLKYFYTKPLRVIRIFFKTLRLGLFPLIINVLWSSKRDFFKRLKTPYIYDSNVDEVALKAA